MATLAPVQHMRLDRMKDTYFWYDGWLHSAALAPRATFSAWLAEAGISAYSEPGYRELVRHAAINFLLERACLRVSEQPYGLRLEPQRRPL